VETGGVATTCAAGCLPPGVGVAIVKLRGVMKWREIVIKLSFLGVAQGQWVVNL
jgi:hypothetical protein